MGKDLDCICICKEIYGNLASCAHKHKRLCHARDWMDKIGSWSGRWRNHSPIRSWKWAQYPPVPQSGRNCNKNCIRTCVWRLDTWRKICFYTFQDGKLAQLYCGSTHTYLCADRPFSVCGKDRSLVCRHTDLETFFYPSGCGRMRIVCSCASFCMCICGPWKWRGLSALLGIRGCWIDLI